ncbi:MAG: metal-binding protein [Eubacterium sp.]|nr:metal-binding protein [Eubacterium sp.]
MKNSSRFFENRECRYFPCHKDQEPFNCLFCYCPFYLKEKCPGNPAWLKVKKRPAAANDGAGASDHAEAGGNAAGGIPEPSVKAGYKIIKDCTNCTFPHRPESYDVIIDFIRKENETREFSREIWDKAVEI